MIQVALFLSFVVLLFCHFFHFFRLLFARSAPPTRLLFVRFVDMLCHDGAVLSFAFSLRAALPGQISMIFAREL